MHRASIIFIHGPSQDDHEYEFLRACSICLVCLSLSEAASFEREKCEQAFYALVASGSSISFDLVKAR